MKRGILALLTFVTVMILSVVQASAGCWSNDYFTGEVNRTLMHRTSEIQSRGEWSYLDWRGEPKKNVPIGSSHFIYDQTTSRRVKDNTITTSDSYLRNIRAPAVASHCYVAKLQVASACVADSWGSAKICVPEEEENEPGGTEDPTNTEPSPSTPIVLDLAGDGFRFSSLESGVVFDFDGDGLAEPTSWIASASNEAFLALDRNLDGKIDKGSELFGNYTEKAGLLRP